MYVYIYQVCICISGIHTYVYQVYVCPHMYTRYTCQYICIPEFHGASTTGGLRDTVQKIKYIKNKIHTCQYICIPEFHGASTTGGLRVWYRLGHIRDVSGHIWDRLGRHMDILEIKQD